MTYEGVLHFHAETGTEGGFWAFQDQRFISKRNGEEAWSYEGLHILKDGDKLTIFDKEDSKKTLWSGTIQLKHYPQFTEDASGWWIHSDQEGLERAQWAIWFFKEFPARLEALEPGG